MITPKKVHDKCAVEIQLTNSLPHYASLNCCDTACTRRKKHVQWLNKADVAKLEAIGIPVKNPIDSELSVN